MSWGISENATEKEKIFADYNDSLMGMNSADGLSYHHYSRIYDIGRKLADKEYQQGKADGAREFAEWWFNKPEATNPDFDEWMDVFIAEWQKGQTDGKN